MLEIYSIIFVVGYFISIFLMIKNTRKIGILFVIVTIALLFILSGLRSMNVGYDNLGHLSVFENIANGQMSFKDFKEPGYGLLSLIISFFGEYDLFIIIYSLLLLILLLVSTKYFSINPFITIYIYYALYFLGNNMAKLRQGIAVLILLIGLQFLNKGNKKGFVILVIIASTFHASSLFFILLLMLYKINLSKKTMFSLLILSVLIGQLGIVDYFYNVIVNSQFLASIDLLGLNRVLYYTDTLYNIRTEGGYLGYLYNIISAVIIVWFYDKLTILGSKAAILAKTYYWGVIISILLFNLPLLNQRIAMPFLLTQIFLLPFLFKCIENKYLRFLFSSFYLLVILIKGYISFHSNYTYFVPFEFFWEK